MSVVYVAVAVGVLLVLVGVILTTVQLLRGGPEVPSRVVRAGAGPLKISLKTTFPGLILVVCGVLVVVVGVIAKLVGPGKRNAIGLSSASA
jgi:hypothetical protein